MQKILISIHFFCFGLVWDHTWQCSGFVPRDPSLWYSGSTVPRIKPGSRSKWPHAKKVFYYFLDYFSVVLGMLCILTITRLRIQKLSNDAYSITCGDLSQHYRKAKEKKILPCILVQISFLSSIKLIRKPSLLWCFSKTRKQSFLLLPGLGTGWAAGVWVLRADAPSFKRKCTHVRQDRTQHTFPLSTQKEYLRLSSHQLLNREKNKMPPDFLHYGAWGSMPTIFSEK